MNAQRTRVGSGVLPATPKACWFCGAALTAATTSKEHVFPQWLQKELGLAALPITPTWHAEPLGELLDQRNQTWGSLVAGRICRGCNNGWMSELETVAMSVLLPLVRGERDVRQLTPQGARKVAVWAVKTVLTLSAAVQEKRAPMAHYEALYGAPTAVPAGIYVFATQREGLSSPAHYTIDATWAQSRLCATPDEESAVKHESYKACLQLGRLLLLVAWWPLGHEWVLGPEEDLSLPLAPPDAKLVFRPSPDELPQEIRDAAGPELVAQLDTDSGAVALGLTLSVKVFHRGDLPDWLLQNVGIEPLASADTSHDGIAP
jgi:hypothetical protein